MQAMNPPENYRYAGFWTRALATAIDSVVLDVHYPAAGALDLRPRVFQLEFAGPRAEADFLISWVMPMAAVFVLCRFPAATPLQKASGQYFFMPGTGGPLRTGQCIGRCFAYAVSILPLGLGFVWIAFDPRKQLWHSQALRHGRCAQSEGEEPCHVGKHRFLGGATAAKGAEQAETAAPLPGVTFGGQTAHSYPAAVTKL